MSRQRNLHPMQTRSRKFEEVPLDEKSEKVVIDGVRNDGKVIENHIDAPSDSDSDMLDDDGKPDLTGDRHNIALLLFLYILQGIPLGLAGSVPMLLQSRHVSYKQQAIFSFVFWPFSVKLAWAPIVDAIYSKRMGRRKTWMVPAQYLIGIFMLFLSTKVDDLMGGGQDSSPPDVKLLAVFFFILNFLAATQDIAVDGWALTMLSRRNVGWASTCNSVGQTAGYFLGYVLFLALESADFCNRYLRREPQAEGIMTLAGFLYFWGIVFLITTTIVWVFKRERGPRPHEVHEQRGVLSTYRHLWDVVRLPTVKAFAIILITHKMGFAAADAVTGLKLIERGVHRENLALLAIPLTPIQILLPLVISRYTAGPRPMDTFLKAMPFRLIMGVELATMVWLTPYMKNDDGTFPVYYYAMIVVSYSLHQVTLYSMFVATMAFHAQISDPVIGGTYMTLLNTLSNLGGNWPATVALWLVDNLTWSGCDGAGGLRCGGTDLDKACEAAGGTCVTWLDGYYIESAACLIIGFIWLKFMAKTVRELQNKELSAWSAS